MQPWRHRRPVENNAQETVSPSLRLRCQDGGLATLSCSAPLHPRIQYEGRLSRNLWGERARLLVPDATTTQQDWWLPDLSISPLGAMQATKQVWMGEGTPRWGLRVSVRRQLEWSIWNTASELNPNDAQTHWSLQVEGATSSWRTGVRLESTLEEPLAAARATLLTHLHLDHLTNPN